MPDPENEATLQATANLSPVSPSPVHSVAVLAVPALQNTVDTIDAMVAAASAAPNGAPDAPNGFDHDHDLDQNQNHDHDHDHAMTAAAAADPMEDPVDDDSFDDAYAEEASEPAAAATVPPEHEAVESDDYAKTFDSPVEPQEGEDFEDHHVSSRQGESNNASLPSSSSSSSAPSSSASASEPLISHTPDVPHLSPNVSATAAQAAAIPPTAVASQLQLQLQLQLEADPRSVVPLSGSSTRAVESPSASNAPAPTQPIAGAGEEGSAARESQQPSVDIQQLVADLIAKPAESSPGASDPSSAKSPVTAQASAASSSLPSTALPSPSSLPPRPPLPQTNSQSYASQHHPAGSNPKHSGDPAPHAPGQSSFVLPGAPGASAEAKSKHSAQASVSSMNAAPNAPDGTNDAEYQRRWAQFMADERQYLSEARWDCFPEGSRIFIGNLSSNSVSKKDVFDLFHKFGRLAQISLKSAYGFVQYHTANEGWKALKNLEGTELKGRRIHLEISRMQEKPKKERNRSSDRNRGARESGRRADKHNRDENRSQRNHSPRRKDHYGRNDRNDRNDSYSGGGGGGGGGSGSGGGGGKRSSYYNSGRSRSPDYKRGDRDYRRRSPSPYGARSRHHDAELEIPRRYGSDVPDVQIIMQPDVSRDFATWTEGAFKARGLKTAVMYLHPRMPKDQVIQRQAAEGVLAVVDLDLRSQSIGRIPTHLFDRSGGMHNVRFEQYVDLEPGTAAEIILRAKAPPAVSYGQPYGYPVHQYGAQPAPAAGYPAMPQAGAYPPQQPSGPSAADIASLMGRVDNATLQKLLSTIQATSPGTPAQGAHPGFPQAGPNPAAPSLGGQVDIQAILGSLSSNQGPQHHPPQAPYDGQYRGHPQGSPSSAPPGGDAAAAQVQNIMAQLARYRQ